LLCFVVEPVQPRSVGLETNCVDARVGTAATSELLKCLEDVGLLVIDGDVRFGSFSRHLQAIRKAIDCDDVFSAEQSRAGDRKLSDRAAPPYSDSIARLDVAHLGAHVAGWKDVGEEE